MSHNAPYFTPAPTTPTMTHSSTQKYSTLMLSRKGRRNRNRLIDTGAQRMLKGAAGTGRKGAMAVPRRCK